jgi:peroxiredoxin
LAAAAGLVSACVVAPRSEVAAAFSEAADLLPNAPVVTLAGEPTQVGRVVGGRVALVSLWATWCEGCEREFDELNRLDERAARRGDVVVIGIAMGEQPSKVADFVRRRGLRYMQLVDEEFRFGDALGARRVPATLVVDRSGRVVYRGDALDASSLAALKDALAANAAPRAAAP